MLFNKSYKKQKDDNANIEEELKLNLNVVKNELQTLQQMRQRNTIGNYYNAQFRQPVVEQVQKTNIRMISTHNNYNNNNFLKHAFNDNKRSNHFVLNHRVPNYNRNEQFSLQIHNNKKSNEIIENDFTVSDDENSEDSEDSDDDIDFDLLLNNKKKESVKMNKTELDKIDKKALENSILKEKFKSIEENTYLPEPKVKNEENDILGNNLTEYLQNGNKVKNELYILKTTGDYDEIEKTCYTIWHTKNLPPLMEENFKLLQENNPEIDFQLYDEKEARLFIKNNFDSDVLDAYDRLAPSSYKSDLWRYCILYKKGGIYLDIKYNTINNFKLVELCNKEHFVYDHANNSDNKSFWNKNEFGLYTALIVSKPGNKILRQCIHKITENTENFYYGKNALYPTGPGLLGQSFFSNQFHINKIKEIQLFHHDDSNAIVYKNTKILDVYQHYRQEQSTYQNNLHYSLLWSQRCIYNMKFSVMNLNKNSRVYNEFLPKILCICHIGSYHVFEKMKSYIDNLISAHYDDYNLTIYFNIVETISKEHMNEIKKMYPEEHFILSENYGFDIGSFFHILEIVKQRKEKYDYVVKIHTKTNNEKRENLLQPILGNIQTIRKIIQQMKDNDNIGIIASKKARCIDTHTDFVRNQSYLQQLVSWYFNEKTRITKQVYVTGTMFWMRFDIVEQLFMKINLYNIINSFNNIHSFDWNWYYYSNNKFLMNVNLQENALYEHYMEKGKNMNLSGNIFHAIKNGTRSFHLRDGMMEHAYERFFCYASHRLGLQIMFIH
jgi:mannosyltransferase OCH1-like enzyme